MEKCLVLITSSDCLHDDEIFEESESPKPSNSILKLADMVIKHFFSRILLFLSWLGLFFGLVFFVVLLKISYFSEGF